MKAKTPFFSIIIPTYNSGATLDLALNSIYNQTFKNVEVLIMDGLSSDNTLPIAETYKNKIESVAIFSESDFGIYDAMNKGIEKAKGDWLYFLGSDDTLFENTTFEKIASTISLNKVDLIYGNVFSNRFNGIYDGEFNCSKLASKNICHQAMFFNKTIFKKIGKFNLKYKSHADWDHNIRCFYSSKIKTKFIDNIIANYADGGFSSLNFDETFNKIRPYKCLYLGYNKLNKKTIKKLIKKILNYKNRSIKINLKKNNKLVSICIPTYNGASFLQEALNSVIKQTYKNIEVIISDDASADNTLEIAEKFKVSVDFPVSIISHKPNGIGANWNNTIKNANGAYIKFLFQDDILYPDCISEMIATFKENPNLGLVACKRDLIVEGDINSTIVDWIDKFKNLQSQFETANNMTIIDKNFFSEEYFLLGNTNKIGEPSAVMFKKEVVKDVGYFDEKLKQILDYVFYYRILKKHPIAIINKPLVAFRIHENQATNVNRNKDISDYKKYKKILYKEFLSLLHPNHKKKLVLKFSKTAQLKKKLKSVLRKFRP